jgi:hypothetical protein
MICHSLNSLHFHVSYVMSSSHSAQYCEQVKPQSHMFKVLLGICMNSFPSHHREKFGLNSL